MSVPTSVRRAFVVACAALAFSVLSADSAWACSVCFSSEEDVLPAFYGTALLLTSLPFVLIGGVGYALHRRFKAAARLEEEVA